jgi:hypothetical protein
MLTLYFYKINSIDHRYKYKMQKLQDFEKVTKKKI